MKAGSALAAVVLAGSPSLLHGQSCAWLLQNTPTPPVFLPGGSGAIVFNTATQRLAIVAQVGICEWNGAAWATIPGSAPPATPQFFCAAYDTARQRIVVHGGEVAGLVTDDTYEWNGSAWLHPSSSGPRRSHAAMCFEPTLNRTVLQGGITTGQALDASTWLWDGTSWTAGPAGPPRRDHAMVYDPSTSRLVIHGGSNGTNVFSDMWFYLHPAGWGPVTSTGSPARAQHGMVFDAGRSRIVLFGGTTSVNGSLSPYTFEFAAPAWSIASTTGPSPVLPLLGYDAASARCVLLAANMDTWIYPAPAVLSSPGDQTALPGASVTFIAIPGNPGQSTLRWRKDGVALADDGRITGSATATLRITGVSAADAGGYDMQVTGNCIPGASVPATLSVLCYPNCDNSTVAPVLNVLDFSCFLNRFAAGCP
jgi:hypothetical protein